MNSSKGRHSRLFDESNNYYCHATYLLWITLNVWDQEQVINMWQSIAYLVTVVSLVLLSFGWHPLILQFKINDTFLSSLKLNYFLFNIFPHLFESKFEIFLELDVGTIENNRVQNKWTGFLTTTSRTNYLI